MRKQDYGKPHQNHLEHDDDFNGEAAHSDIDSQVFNIQYINI